MNQSNASTSDLQQHQLVTVIVIEIIEHNPGLGPVKTVIRKTNDDVTSTKFVSDDVFNEHTAQSEVMIHLAAGHARILIDGNINLMNAGDCLKVPANTSRQITDGPGFTLITTDIKGLSI
jgi:quercetin dioxygenase-like cupin family protein